MNNQPDFAGFHAAAALASELHEKIELLRTEAVRTRALPMDQLEDLFMAGSNAERALRRLLRLTQYAANHAAGQQQIAAE